MRPFGRVQSSLIVTNDERVARFLALLAPLHDSARVAARRLCGSRADGDDLFQETALRALDQLASLRDEGRFRPWFYAVMLSVQRERHRRRFWRRLFSLDHVVDEPARAADTEEWEGAERMAQAANNRKPIPAVHRRSIPTRIFASTYHGTTPIAIGLGADAVGLVTMLKGKP